MRHRAEMEAGIWIASAREGTERAFLKPERNEAGREWHERMTAQWRVVQESSLSASPHRSSLGDLSGRFARHAGKAVSQNAGLKAVQLDLGVCSAFSSMIPRENRGRMEVSFCSVPRANGASLIGRLVCSLCAAPQPLLCRRLCRSVGGNQGSTNGCHCATAVLPACSSCAATS